MSINIYGKNPAIEILSTSKKVFNAFVMEDSNQDIIKILKQKEL